MLSFRILFMNTKIKQHCILYCEFFMVYKHTGSFESYIGLGIIFFPSAVIAFWRLWPGPLKGMLVFQWIAACNTDLIDPCCPGLLDSLSFFFEVLPQILNIRNGCYVCAYISGSVCYVDTGTRGGQDTVLGPLELELQGVGSLFM